MENMLRLESGAIREFIGSRMIMAVVDMLIELDVSGSNKPILEQLSSILYNLTMFEAFYIGVYWLG